jgi:hypothetical protein
VKFSNETFAVFGPLCIIVKFRSKFETNKNYVCGKNILQPYSVLVENRLTGPGPGMKELCLTN